VVHAQNSATNDNWLMPLHEQASSVFDQESFLAFIRSLVADRKDEVLKERAKPSTPRGPGANGWENDTIEGFLDAAVSWAEDSQFGKSQGLSEGNPWCQFAVFLYCGKIYE
jgi:hypothetical protein